ncbi:cellulose synthase operon protein YhjQ [Pseudomonas asturiensis]|uniref:Cellulose synthase operon protein YhjQ n=1 Tax=Pseudomonas asturiensis TaxID=1190415 RepID=A0A1M7Q7B6_9PSED|nr:cellulose biosynthesis protein BcsQ [Pseudomonas asturiensis]SHN26359.1 cellulose synthase operon protein YhjQ [Pseudomonas asturiensis]
MTSLSLMGVRGGLGASTLLAAIGYALESLGERVLLVDMCPENMLRLHLGLDAAQEGGWARAMLDGQDWFRQAWSLTPHLHLLPYGALSARESADLELQLLDEPLLWACRQSSLAADYDWILFDLPQRLPGHANPGPCLFPIQLIEADAACHILLQQQPRDTLLLVNRFDPASQLQRDLLLLWRNHCANRLLPLTIHVDEAVREALAFRQPLGQYAPDSLAAQDVLSLATWCLTRRRGDVS